MRLHRVATLLSCLLPGLAGAQWLVAPSPPGQASDGRPGGLLATYSAVDETAISGASSALDYWIFEPRLSGSYPAGNPLPVVIFLHGYSADDPRSYRGWIDHIVKRGRLLVYPRYQSGALTATSAFTPNAISAVRSALNLLAARSPAGNNLPDLSRIAVVGHSIGGVVSVNLAADWMNEGLPGAGSQPLAVFAVEPGKTWGNGNGKMPLSDLGRIPASTLLLTLSGDDDTVAGWCDAKAFWHKAGNVPATNKDYVIVRTDRHGRPGIVANHSAPTALDSALNGPGAFDWHATWKLFDGLSGAVFESSYRDYALGGGYQQTSMGSWSDLVPVTPIEVPDISGEPPDPDYPGEGSNGVLPYAGCN